MVAVSTIPAEKPEAASDEEALAFAASKAADLQFLQRSQERLDAVLKTGLLDTPAEESFDRLTRLAAKLVQVPATFISLVDEGRDFYKSCFGFGEPLATARQLEGQSFCHFALVSSGPLLIPDTMADPVFRAVPTVQSLGVRAYAGIPLITDAGHAIGSFCAIDFKPREWSAVDVEVLTELAASAMREIKLRAALQEAEKQTRVAQEATRSREEVLAVVAHDLRTPLNFIKLGAELIAQDPARAEARDLATRIDGATDLMNLLISDLLEVAKMRAGEVAIDAKPIEVQTLLADAQAMLEPLARRSEVRLSIEAESGLPLVQADYERVLRVFSNLVVNAVKFSTAGGEVRVSAAGGQNVVRFSVSDRGPGIPPEHQARLFDRFWQAEGTDRRGVGLGLSIAHAIVTAHGGKIGVNSAVGEGSTFYFELPSAQRRGAAVR